MSVRDVALGEFHHLIPAGAVAENVHLLTLGEQVLGLPIEFVEAHPAATKVVFEALAKTVRRLSDRVEDLIFLDVPSRVAKYLLDLAQLNGAAGSGELELTLIQDELAAFTGASRVSVNRVLGDLERRDLISIRRRKIAIRDPEKLAKEIRV